MSRREHKRSVLYDSAAALAACFATGVGAGTADALLGLARASTGQPGPCLSNMASLLLSPFAQGFVRESIMGLAALSTAAGTLVMVLAGPFIFRRGGSMLKLCAGTSATVLIAAAFGFHLSAMPPAGRLGLWGPAAGALALAVLGLVQWRIYRGMDRGRALATAFLQAVLGVSAASLFALFYAQRGTLSPAGLGLIFLTSALLCWAAFVLLRAGLVAAAARSAWTRRLRRAGLLAAFLIVLLSAYWQVCGYGLPKGGGEARGPNLVMIVLDTVRPDRLSVYGHYRKTTPFLERLAREGVLFEKAYTPSPWTLPSHASFFTGLYPSEHAAVHGSWWLDSERVTLAEKLKDRGYVTAGFTANPYIGPYTNAAQGFSRMARAALALGPPILPGEMLWRAAIEPLFGKGELDNGGKLAAAVLSRWIGELASADRRFFLFANLMEAHPPYPRDISAFRFFDDPAAARDRLASDTRSYEAFNAGELSMSTDLLEMHRTLYDGCLYYLDQRVAEIYASLEEAGVLNDTVLVVLSDHGESLGEHGMWGHAFGMYKEQLHVPLIVRARGVAAPGAIVAEPFSLERLPGLLEEIMKGSSLEAALEAGCGGPLFAERFTPLRIIERMSASFPDWDRGQWSRDQVSVILGDYHLIKDSRGASELYDIIEDPQETANLLSKERATYRELDEIIARFRLDHPPPVPGGRQGLDPAAVRRLRALGYMK